MTTLEDIENHFRNSAQAFGSQRYNEGFADGVACTKSHDDDQLMTAAETCEFLRMKKSSFYNLLANRLRGFPQAYVPDSHKKWMKSEVRAWLIANRFGQI